MLKCLRLTRRQHDYTDANFAEGECVRGVWMWLWISGVDNML